jgi:hypothetical protein
LIKAEKRSSKVSERWAFAVLAWRYFGHFRFNNSPQKGSRLHNHQGLAEKSIDSRVTDSTPPVPQVIQGELDNVLVVFRAPNGLQSTGGWALCLHDRNWSMPLCPWAGWVSRTRMQSLVLNCFFLSLTNSNPLARLYLLPDGTSCSRVNKLVLTCQWSE